jgi:membrane-associated phospholipid phosphatase
MMQKLFCLFIAGLILIFCANFIYGQDSLTKFHSVANKNIASLNSDNNYLKPSALIAPGTLLLYGGMKPVIKAIPRIDSTVFSRVKQNYPTFHSDAADYLTWAPSASVYVLDAFKIKTAHNFKEHLILDAGSLIITGGLGYGMRLITRNTKVYNSFRTNFPSGHTANAFRGAEILHQELKKTSPWLSYCGYVVASGVGLLRIYNKDHLLSEVLAGAGLGIISTKLTYWIFDKIAYKQNVNKNY